MAKGVRLLTGNYCLLRRFRPNIHRVDRVARPLRHTHEVRQAEERTDLARAPILSCSPNMKRSNLAEMAIFPRWAVFSPNETMEQIEAGNPAF